MSKDNKLQAIAAAHGALRHANTGILVAQDGAFMPPLATPQGMGGHHRETAPHQEHTPHIRDHGAHIHDRSPQPHK